MLEIFNIPACEGTYHPMCVQVGVCLLDSAEGGNNAQQSCTSIIVTHKQNSGTRVQLVVQQRITGLNIIFDNRFQVNLIKIL